MAEITYKKGPVTGSFHKLPVLVLAIVIDIIMIIPFVDFVFTVWLQVILWNRLNHLPFMWINITYDFTDLLSGGMFLDVFPLNTVCVIAVLIYSKTPYNI